MRMFCQMCGHIKKERIKNEKIRSKVGVAPIEDKIRKNWLRWFGHVNGRPINTPVRICNYKMEAQAKGVEEDLERL